MLHIDHPTELMFESCIEIYIEFKLLLFNLLRIFQTIQGQGIPGVHGVQNL